MKSHCLILIKKTLTFKITVTLNSNVQLEIYFLINYDNIGVKGSLEFYNRFKTQALLSTLKPPRSCMEVILEGLEEDILEE